MRHGSAVLLHLPATGVGKGARTCAGYQQDNDTYLDSDPNPDVSYPLLSYRYRVRVNFELLPEKVFVYPGILVCAIEIEALKGRELRLIFFNLLAKS